MSEIHDGMKGGGADHVRDLGMSKTFFEPLFEFSILKKQSFVNQSKGIIFHADIKNIPKKAAHEFLSP